MAKKTSNLNNLALIGRWAFVIGLLIAILSGIPSFPELKGIMLLLGIVIGLLNITAVETGPFLLAVIALMLAVGNLNLGYEGAMGTILRNILLFLSPASIIVSLKAIYVLARG